MVFIPSFIVMVFIANYLIRSLKIKSPHLYKKVIGGINDTYLSQWETIGFRHLRRLDLLVFSGRHIKEIGIWTTFIYVIATTGYVPTFIYIVTYIIVSLVV